METHRGSFFEDGLLQGLLSKWAAVDPGAMAVRHGQETWTYAEASETVARTSAALRRLGIVAGDRVAMISPPRPEFWFLLLATVTIGAVWTGLDPRYKAQERTSRLGNARPRVVIIVDDATSCRDGLAGDAASWIEIRLDGAGSAGANMASFCADADGYGARDYSELSGGSPAVLVYTSGSTGQPKGALITHQGLVAGSELQARHFAVDRPSIICNLPISHVGCIADVCCTTLARGGTIIFQERFDPGAVLRTVAKERVKILGGVPTMFLALIDHPLFPTVDLSSVELVLWGGAAMPEHAVRALRNRGLRLKTAYGMTETSCHVAFTPDDADDGTLSSTVGRADPLVRVRVVDADGIEVRSGESGELQVLSDMNFLAYFEDEQATQAAFDSDGWLSTGDFARIDAEGMISLQGRRSEMYKSGGYNVYPREVENVLEAHPTVAAAAVFGVPDPYFQEVGAAAVQPKAGTTIDEDRLFAYLRSTLANYKVPKTIAVYEMLPTLPIGKVDKGTIRSEVLSRMRGAAA